jgi:hypothetical protein
VIAARAGVSGFLISAMWLSCAASAIAQQSEWLRLMADKDGQTILEYRIEQDYRIPGNDRPLRFTAVRAHLEYFFLELVAGKSTAVKQNDSLVPDLRAFVTEWTGENPVVAAIPAGFPQEINSVANAGLLRVDNEEIEPFLGKIGPSAILCLWSPNNRGLGFQVPTFYRSSDPEQVLTAESCEDAVQVGPRILEDSKSPYALAEGLTRKYYQSGPHEEDAIYFGITEAERERTPYRRTVFAVDDPHRPSPSRNAYFIAFFDEVNLWDVQELLTQPDFYGNEDYYPAWAVNLVGGIYPAMIVPGLAEMQVSIDSDSDVPGEGGNAQIGLSSALLLVRRQDRP